MKKNIVIIIAFVIVLLIVGGIGIFSYTYLTNKQPENEIEATKYESKIDELNDKTDNIKKDTQKDLIYNADYMYDIEQKIYEGPNGEQYSIYDIVIPYININSTEVEQINQQLEQLYLDLVQDFKQNMETDNTSYVKSSYMMFINSNILSVLITVDKNQQKEYFSCNISLETLTNLSYENVYIQCGFTSIDIDNNITSRIQEYLNNKDGWTDEEEKSTYISNTINNYQTAVSDNIIQYFIDLNRKLNVIIPIQTPTGVYDTILIIE